MILSTSIRSWFEYPIRWVKTVFSLKGGLIFLLVVLFSAFVAVMVSETVEKCIGQLLGLSEENEKNEILTFLGIGMGGILLALQAVIANRRARALEDTVLNTERGQRQERFKNAIEHLGHQSVSVRLGGAYELFHLAEDTTDEAKDLRQTVLDILCAHIRQTTGEKEYRQDYPSKPSEEVQSLLTLLFVQEYKVFKGCHINLQGSWLNGANLKRAHLQGSNLVEAYLQGTELQEAKLHGANLVEASLQEAELGGAHMHGARLRKAHLQRAILEHARLYGADLVEAKLQVAYLHKAQLQGTSLMEARLQGVDLSFTHLGGIHYQDRGMPFAEHIRYWIGRESESHAAIFEGGLSREDVDSLVEGLLNENAKKDLREKLEPHIGEPESNELPEDSGAITGAYTEEEAEQWIAEYEEAMSAVPKADNGQ